MRKDISSSVPGLFKAFVQLTKTLLDWETFQLPVVLGAVEVHSVHCGQPISDLVVHLLTSFFSPSPARLRMPQK